MRTTSKRRPASRSPCELVRLLHPGHLQPTTSRQCMVEVEALPAGRPGQLQPGRGGAHGDGGAQPARAAAAARERHAGGDRVGAGTVQPPRPPATCWAPSWRAPASCSARDLAWLSVHDPVRDEFRVLAGAGRHLRRTVSDMVAVRGRRRRAAWCMSTRLPFTTADYLHDTRFPHDQQLDATFRDEGIAALVGVPLICGGRGDRPAVRGRPLPPHPHGAEHLDPVDAGHPRGGGASRTPAAFEAVPARRREERRCGARRSWSGTCAGIQAAAEAHEQMTSLLATRRVARPRCASRWRQLLGRQPGGAGRSGAGHRPAAPRPATRAGARKHYAAARRAAAQSWRAPCG